jgi:hypothetical protein
MDRCAAVYPHLFGSTSRGERDEASPFPPDPLDDQIWYPSSPCLNDPLLVRTIGIVKDREGTSAELWQENWKRRVSRHRLNGTRGTVYKEHVDPLDPSERIRSIPPPCPAIEFNVGQWGMNNAHDIVQLVVLQHAGG